MAHLAILGSAPSFVIVFKTHFWDNFAERQYRRYAQSRGCGQIYVFLDETAGPIDLPHDIPALRATNAELVADGYADRSERGSLLWWNTDYPNYYMQKRLPSFDYYLFVEYDSCLLGNVEAFVAAAAAHGADLVALPTRTPLDSWMWTRFHTRTYPRREIAGSLNCISLYAREALLLLGRRRREMSELSVQGGVAFWPGNEVFVATEIARAGLRLVSLEMFGDATGYEWHPPQLEEDVAARAPDGLVFLHPVLDRRRYIASLLKFERAFGAYLQPHSALRRALARFPEAEWRPLLGPALAARLRMRARERLEGFSARLGALAARLRRPAATGGAVPR